MTHADDSPLILSVSGARGIVGASMTPVVALEYAAAFASHLKATGAPRQPVVCLGRDTRPSSPMLAAAAAAGLAGSGARVVDLGVVPTPTVGVMASGGADGGLVVTASHNPSQWNGIKCINRLGMAPAPSEAAEIARRYREHEVEWAAFREIPRREHEPRALEQHVDRVLAGVDGEAVRRARLKVALDPNHGAGARAGRMLLEALGCEVLLLNGEPDGQFAHGLEPVPENLEQLARATAAGGFVAGFAQDPDADRLAIVDERGRCLGEEYTLVLAAWMMLKRHGPGPIVVNLSTSRMIDDLAGRFPGTSVLRTAVGEANVAMEMRARGARVGGEGNGGVILPEVVLIRDSLGAMAQVLALRAGEGRPLSALAASIPGYAMIKHRIEIRPGAQSVEAMDRVAARFRGARLDTSDGVRIDIDEGWVHLRPSNTEPIIRLIAEARTRERAMRLIEEVAKAAGL